MNVELSAASLESRLKFIACPVCRGSLTLQSDSLRCEACRHDYRFEQDIPLLFAPNDWEPSKEDVTERIKAFYEKDPFPNYDDMDSTETLRFKAQRGVFARLLDEQIPHGSKILEAGCGTGQLSNFLGLTWGRTVFGGDLCLNSLKLGQKFKKTHGIENTTFLQMNLFRPAFKPETFDVVICNGVLHHTSDPYLGFQSLSKLVKKNGHIVIGLYHTYGRIATDVRRFIFNATGNRFKFLDPRLRNKSLNELRKHTWFMDQYKNPHESKHTIGEVLKWFDKNGIEFVKSIPKASLGESFSEQEKLFEPSSRGTAFDHFLIQTGMLIAGDQEGGFFIMIGKKL